MRKTLLTAVALFGSMLINPVNAGEKKPHEQVQKYLDPFGVAREEFRFKHYLFRDKKEVLHYNRSYDFGGKPFIEQYVIINPVVPNKNGISSMISTYPNYYFFEGIWYFDPIPDGFNGNEILNEGGAVKKPGTKTANEEKCGSIKRGFCV